MKIFFHLCCAPCAIYPFYRLREEGMVPTAYFYNPNIHPYLEYRKRMDAVREFALRTGLEVLYQDGYDLEEFLMRTAGKGPLRCEHCYRMRLEAAAKAARAKGFSVYTSSLLYSKYQKHDVIKAVAQECAEESRIEFYYEDFRLGWREGIVESKAMGLYRQQYCGCIYSERDRYRKR